MLVKTWRNATFCPRKAVSFDIAALVHADMDVLLRELSSLFPVYTIWNPPIHETKAFSWQNYVQIRTEFHEPSSLLAGERYILFGVPDVPNRTVQYHYVDSRWSRAMVTAWGQYEIESSVQNIAEDLIQWP
jgi:hypothetical protein